MCCKELCHSWELCSHPKSGAALNILRAEQGQMTFLLSSGDQPISPKKAHSRALQATSAAARVLQVTKQPGLTPAELQECSEPSSRWATKAHQEYCFLPLHCRERSFHQFVPCIAAQDTSNLARKEAWSSLRHPKLPKGLLEQPGLYFSPHRTDRLHERTKPAPAQLQRNVFLWQREERWSGCHVFPLNFCLSPQQSQITYRRLKAS